MASFQQTQRAFSAQIRQLDGAAALEDVPTQRLQVYQELFFNNVRGFLDNGFPVLRSLYTDDNWEQLARDFFAHHHCQTPYFAEISQEFLSFLHDEYEVKDSDPAFLWELAHYEWAELALMSAKIEVDWTAYNRQGDLLAQRLILSPVAQCLRYNWAVHTISDEQVPDTPEETHIIIYRDPDDEVRFIEANPVLARLFELLQADAGCNRAKNLILQIAEELQHPNPEMVVQGGLQMLTRLQHLHIILGSQS